MLDSRDHGFFTVALPEFWVRPELSGMLRDVRQKPDRHEGQPIFLSSDRFSEA